MIFKDLLTFADDTSIFFRHSALCRAAAVVNKELRNVSVWFTGGGGMTWRPYLCCFPDDNFPLSTPPQENLKLLYKL